jgi:hypothetical protein
MFANFFLCSSFLVQAMDKSQAEVMMVGMFHFSSPGKDSVKVKHIDVMTKESQSYLKSLSQKIAEEFKPTLVLLEYAQKNDSTIQQRYQQYQSNEYQLQVNEIYQLGFRVARASGGIPIASFDERGIGWAAERLFETMPTTAPKIKKTFDDAIKFFTERGNKAHLTMNLRELLLQHNDPEFDRANKGLYLLTNPVSTDGEFEGALASSSWWHRNFRMYAKIQQHAKAGERILVIGGQGHTAILKDFLAIDGQIKGIDVRPLL